MVQGVEVMGWTKLLR